MFEPTPSSVSFEFMNFWNVPFTGIITYKFLERS